MKLPYPLSYLVSGDIFYFLFGSVAYEVIENDLDNKIIYYQFVSHIDEQVFKLYGKHIYQKHKKSTYKIDYSINDTVIRLLDEKGVINGK